MCGGALVKISACFLLMVLLGLSGSAALADGAVPNDPGFKVGGGGLSPVILTANDPIYAGTFTKTSTTQNTVFFEFINGTGFTAGATNLDVTDNATLTFLADNTGDPYWANASPLFPGVTLSPGGHLTISFFGTDSTHPGLISAIGCTTNDPGSCTSIPSASDFFFEVSVADMAVGNRFDFTGTLVPLPEPPTILLFLAGGLLLFLLKRSRGISTLRLAS